MFDKPLNHGAIELLLALVLVDAEGGTEQQWLDLIGEIEELPLWDHPHCNWRINPRGSPDEVEAIERAEDRIVNNHPYVCGRHEPFPVPS